MDRRVLVRFVWRPSSRHGPNPRCFAEDLELGLSLSICKATGYSSYIHDAYGQDTASVAKNAQKPAGWKNDLYKTYYSCLPRPSCDDHSKKVLAWESACHGEGPTLILLEDAISHRAPADKHRDIPDREEKRDLRPSAPVKRRGMTNDMPDIPAVDVAPTANAGLPPRPAPLLTDVPLRKVKFRDKTKTCPAKHVVSNHRGTHSQTARRRRPSPHLDPRLEGRSRARMPVPGGLPPLPAWTNHSRNPSPPSNLQSSIAPVAHPKRPPHIVSHKNDRPRLVRFRF